MALWDDIRFQFRNGGILNQLIFLNAGSFVLLKIVKSICELTENRVSYFRLEEALSLPASIPSLIFQPWSIITHMFVHVDFWHMLINLVFLYLTGKIFLNFDDSKRLLSTYILGGITGATAFVISMNVFPMLSRSVEFSMAMGSSAATLSIALAAAVTSPNFTVHFMWLWPLRLKYVVGIFVLTDILTLTDGNVGGHIAHLGGAFFGFIFASQLKRGNNLSIDFLRPLHWLRNHFPMPKRRIKVVHSRPKSDHDYNAERASKQEQIDTILDKIKRSGYDSLSKKEKEILFRNSKEI